MTRAADASQEAVATRLPLIEGIQADLATIDLSAVQLPEGDVCSHFVVVGNADEPVKRLLILRETVEQKIDKLANEAVFGAFATALESLNKQGGGVSELQELLFGKPDFKNLGDGKHEAMRYTVIDAMLTDALNSAFPEHASRELLVRQDGAVGYIDHSVLVEEAVQRVKAEIASGAFDFSGYPPEAIAALKAGEFDVKPIGDSAFGLSFRRPMPARN